MNRIKFSLLTLIILLTTSCKDKSYLWLPQILSENMVLQQNDSVNIWGKSNKNAVIHIETDWGENSVITSDNLGYWSVKIKTAEAGGPYSIKILNNSKEIVIDNILLGEVWLASGQSNMEMPLKGWMPNEPVEDSDYFIENSDNDNIRFFTVERDMSSTPLDNLVGEWRAASTETSGEFSATAYFFANKLYKETNTPIGIIVSSWGGTPIQPWIPADKISSDADYINIERKLLIQEEQQQNYDEWLASLESREVKNADSIDVLLNVYDEYFIDNNLEIDSWGEVELPNIIENTEIGQFDGIVWFKKEIIIPSHWSGKNLTLSLGAVDDMDIVYINDEIIGSTLVDGAWRDKRFYTIPSEFVESGKVMLTIKLIDFQGAGGFTANKKDFELYVKDDTNERISLAGTWKYKIAAEIINNIIYCFNPQSDDYANRPKLDLALNFHTPSVLYNAMIAPIINYNFRGFIWYQGETNVGQANQYLRLKKILIDGWRDKFSNPLAPFYYVQLAPGQYDGLNEITSANLREAQRRLDLPNIGMAVTIDVGKYDGIHPPKKQPVGERLALLALKNTYGEEFKTSPVLSNVLIENRGIALTFTNVDTKLIIDKSVPNQFEIAGENGIFYSANAFIRGDYIVFVNSPLVFNPKYVRYGYKNGAKASLFDNNGMPISSFTTEEKIID